MAAILTDPSPGGPDRCGDCGAPFVCGLEAVGLLVCAPAGAARCAPGRRGLPLPDLHAAGDRARARARRRRHRPDRAALNATPLLDLGLRPGEGSGAALAILLRRAAARLPGETASSEDARIRRRA